MKCVGCEKIFSGYGNNGNPLYNGVVCNECNVKVIEKRIDNMFDKKEKE